MTHDVFISHSSKDKTIADAICANLEAAGVRCWIAPRDIAPGEDWPRAIANAISQCRVMVLIFSANANSSDQISRELSMASDYNLAIIPFKIDNVKPEPGKQYYLGRTHWLDAMNPPTQSQVNVLVERVKSIIPDAEVSGGRKFSLPTGYEVPVREKRAGYELPALPRRTVITVGLIALGLGLLTVFFKPLSALPAQSFVASTPALTFTASENPTPIFTSTPYNLPTPIFTQTALPDYPDYIDEKGTPMRFVPAGEFIMGRNTGPDNERPVHTVHLDGYYMDKYEVTNVAYKQCVDSGTCQLPADVNRYNDPYYSDHPVVYVDWNMAKTYCEWRGARLPTEAEWEKAARGSDGRTYPWGDGMDCNKANSQSVCVSDTTKVGSYESGKSPYGIYDMAGNVWEWVNDWYDEQYYQSSPASNPLGPDSGQYRVLRGGSWSDNGGTSVRSAFRLMYVPEHTDYLVGFRCSRSISP
jgi:formylglycine-generating enzyme required for sulfatase activity